MDPCRTFDADKKNCASSGCMMVKMKKNQCVSGTCHDPLGAKKQSYCVTPDCSVHTKSKKCDKDPNCMFQNGACVLGVADPCAGLTAKGQKKCLKQSGCMWTGTACMTGVSDPCAGNTSSRACLKAGCGWNGSSCSTSTTPVTCDMHTDKKTCGQAAGCDWSKQASTCSSAAATPSPTPAATCSSFTDKKTCANMMGCDWDRKAGVCNTLSLPSPTPAPTTGAPASCAMHTEKKACNADVLRGCTWDRKAAVCA